jgi:hypothetical protein
MTKRKPSTALKLSDLVRLVEGDHEELPDLESAEAAIDDAGSIGFLYSDLDGASVIDDIIEERVKVIEPDDYALLSNDPAGVGAETLFAAADRICHPSKRTAYYMGLVNGWRLAQRLQSGGVR